MTSSADEHGLRHDEPGFRLVIAPEFSERLSQGEWIDAAGYESMSKRAPRVPGGRTAHRMVDVGRHEGDVIRIRPSRHGGLLSGLLGDRFLSPKRTLREFEVWTLLRERGVRLPEPVFAVAYRRGLFWRSEFGALDRPHAQDGAAWLETHSNTADLSSATGALARTIRQLHDAGALHGDLQLRNILLERNPDASESGPLDCHLIDLERTRLRGAISPAQRMRELMRLGRSLEKTTRGDVPEKALCARMLAAYCEGDRPLRRAMLRSARFEGIRRLRHRLAWRIARGLSRVSLTAILLVALGCADEAPAGARAESETIRWSLLATGDTGRTGAVAELFEGQLSVAKAMTIEARRRPVDGLVLLGDNFYWHGLDRESLVPRLRTNLVRPYCYFLDLTARRSGEIEQACPVPPSDRRPTPIYAVFGNHDIELPESVDLQRNAIPDFLPGWTMSSSLAQVFEVADGVSLILFESELAIRDEPAIKRALIDALATARGPWRILATHRPIATDDLGNPPLGGYPVWVREALAESGRAVQLVLAGHHHSMQAFEIGAPTPSLHLGLGSGSRALPPLAKDHPEARFGALALGFARIDLMGEGDLERLAISIIEAPRWPWLAAFQNARTRARFEVDRRGRVLRMATP